LKNYSRRIFHIQTNFQLFPKVADRYFKYPRQQRLSCIILRIKKDMRLITKKR